jgi:hypothetical protein
LHILASSELEGITTYLGLGIIYQLHHKKYDYDLGNHGITYMLYNMVYENHTTWFTKRYKYDYASNEKLPMNDSRDITYKAHNHD